MSIFSSLNYLLTKAASAINQTASTEKPQDEILQEIKSFNNIPLNCSDEISTDNSSSYTRCAHLLLDTFTSSFEAEVNNSLLASPPENWTDIINIPPASSKAFWNVGNTNLRSNENHFPNDTYPDAQNLLDSWWNIFDKRYLRHGWGWTVTLIIAYMIILVAGVIGNILVILVVLLRRQMRSVTNMFIMNLAIADFFVIVFCVPSTLLANIFAPWILGNFMCKAVAYVQGVSVCASAYSLAAISLDRCQAVYRSYERPRGFSRKTCAKTILTIWVAALSLTIPWAVVFEVKVSEFDGLRYCVETWENEKDGNIYFIVVNLVCFYMIPLLLIFIANWIIYCHVARREIPDNSAASAPLRKIHRDTRRHVRKMLAIVTLTFLISWLPVYSLVIFIKFSDNIIKSDYKLLGILMPIAQWLGTWNSSINPILYAFLNKKFRKMMKSIIPTWFSSKSGGKKSVSFTTPTFTTGCSDKSFRTRTRNNSKNNFYQNIRTNYQSQTNNIVVSTHNEHMRTLPKQIISSVISTALDFQSGGPSGVINLGIAQGLTTEIEVHL